MPTDPPRGQQREGTAGAGEFDNRRAIPNREYLRILADCRDLASHRMLVSLTSMMDRLGDGLLAQANRAAVLSETTMLLESRSVLQSNRAFIVNAFEKGFRARIDRRLQGESERKAEEPTEEKPLELVDDAQVEEDIAIKSFTQSLANRCQEELAALNARIGFLLGERQLTTVDNPFGPRALGTAFREAWQGVDIRREAKVVVLNMMDGGMMGDINAIYADINRHLSNLNVLPQLARVAVPRGTDGRAASAGAGRMGDDGASGAGGSSRGGAGAMAAQASGDGDLFAMLRDLMGRAQRSGRGTGAQAGVNTGSGGGGAAGEGGGSTGGSASGSAGSGGGSAGSGGGSAGSGGGSGGGVDADSSSGGISSSQLAAYIPWILRARRQASGSPGGNANGQGLVATGSEIDVSGGFATQAAGSDVGQTGGEGYPGVDAPGVDRDGAPVDDIDAVAIADPRIIITSLTRLQQSYGGGVTAPGNTTAPLVAFDPNLLRSLGPRELGSQLDAISAVTIELVAMLFDFVHAERKLPDAIKALLFRLQIPVLKAAMIDKEFFSRRTHPARLLVNRYAEAGFAWRVEHGLDDPLYLKIQEGVSRIQGGFTDDLGVFTQVLTDFETFLVSEEETAEQAVQVSAEEIARRERQELASIVADAELDRRINSALPPDFLVAFLRNQWRRVLMNAYLETGEEGAGWRAVLAELDNLLWSVQPKRRVKDRKDLITRLPEMVSRLRARLSDIEWEIDAREKFMTELVECHARAVTATYDADTVTGAKPLSGRLAAEDAEPLSVRADGPPADRYHDLAETMGRGMWVEFTEDSGKLVFARLSWVSPLRGKYLFTHRNGSKAFSLKREELAKRFRDDTARPVETEPLLDRAFSDVLSRLSAQAGV